MKRFGFFILLFLFNVIAWDAMYAAQRAQPLPMVPKQKRTTRRNLSFKCQQVAARDRGFDGEIDYSKRAAPLPITPQKKEKIDRTLARQRQQIAALEASAEEKELSAGFECLDLNIETLSDLSHELYNQMMVTAALSLAVAYATNDLLEQYDENNKKFDRLNYYYCGQFALQKCAVEYQIAQSKSHWFEYYDPFKIKASPWDLQFSCKEKHEASGHMLTDKEWANVKATAADHETSVRYRYKQYEAFFPFLKLLEVNYIGGAAPLTLVQLVSIAYEQIVYLSMTFGLVFPAEALAQYNAFDFPKNKKKLPIPELEFILNDLVRLLNISKKMLVSVKFMADDLGIPFNCKRYKGFYGRIIEELFGANGHTSMRMQSIISNYANKYRGKVKNNKH